MINYRTIFKVRVRVKCHRIDFYFFLEAVNLVDSNLRNQIYQAEQKSSSTDIVKRLEALEDSQSYLIRTVQDIEMKQENPDHQKANEPPDYTSSYSSETEMLRNLEKGLVSFLP